MHEQFSSHSLFRARAHAAHGEHREALQKLVLAKAGTRQKRALQDLEAALLAHLRAEEELLLPDFGLEHASEAAHIRAQHEQLRQLVARSARGDVDDATEEDTLRQLADLLRACTTFEERVLYPWAEQQLRASKKGEFVQRARQRG